MTGPQLQKVISEKSKRQIAAREKQKQFETPAEISFYLYFIGRNKLCCRADCKRIYKSLENVDSTETAETKQNDLSNEVHSQQPIADISQATDKAPPPAPAKFSMQAANYNIVESELGPVLDIAITVANIGEEAGRPKLFEIELVDDANKQLMKWPMAASAHRSHLNRRWSTRHV